jgi:hypothetical protein
MDIHQILTVDDGARDPSMYLLSIRISASPEASASPTSPLAEVVNPCMQWRSLKQIMGGPS